MKTVAMVTLVALIPVGALAGHSSLENGIEQAQVPANTEQGLEGSPVLTKCKGRKCSGPGDTIRNEQDVQGTPRLSGDRGGEATAGDKKGRRRHHDPIGTPLLTDNRGGQASAGGKKGRRLHDDSICNPASPS